MNFVVAVGSSQTRIAHIGTIMGGLFAAAFILIMAVRVIVSPDYYYRTIEKVYGRRDKGNDGALWQQARLASVVVMIVMGYFVYRLIVGAAAQVRTP
jgi:multisubunit Na+/H+ antiporter MnhF subunit